MANVRIKDLSTTASTTASDDFFGVDGATNGTRKLNAYSPTFGGNLTVSGTGTSSFASGSTLRSSGTVSLDSGNTSFRYDIYRDSAGTYQIGHLVNYGSQTGYGGFTWANVDNGKIWEVTNAGAGTLKGNLTVSGTGTSSVAGNFLLGTTTDVGPRLLSKAKDNSYAGAGIGIVDQSAGTSYITRANGTFYISNNGSTDHFTLNSSGDATFAGKITANGAGSTFKGTATNDSAAAGYVGEIITSTVESGSAVSLTSTVIANVTSISLTAGDWDVTGIVAYSTSGATVTQFLQGFNNASAALGPVGSFSKINQSLSSDTDSWLHNAPTYRFSLSATSTVYLIARSYFSAGTVGAYGFIRARRVR